MNDPENIIQAWPPSITPNKIANSMKTDSSGAVCSRCAKYESERPDSKQGICRAHPPTVLLVGHIPPLTSMSHPQPVVQAFPTQTPCGGWCWEFEPRNINSGASSTNLLRIPTDDDAAA